MWKTNITDEKKTYKINSITEELHYGIMTAFASIAQHAEMDSKSAITIMYVIGA